MTEGNSLRGAGTPVVPGTRAQPPLRLALGDGLTGVVRAARTG